MSAWEALDRGAAGKNVSQITFPLARHRRTKFACLPSLPDAPGSSYRWRDPAHCVTCHGRVSSAGSAHKAEEADDNGPVPYHADL